jgi:hypothetical protein
VISAFAVIASSILFFFRQKIRLNITLVIFSALIGMYAVETAIHSFTLNFPLVGIIKVGLNGQVLDTRDSLEVLQDFRKQLGKENVVRGVAAGASAEYENLVSLAGVSKRLTIPCSWAEGGYWGTYTSDRFGFNNPDEVWDQSNADVMLLGDSFTLGVCVNAGDDIAGQLRKYTKNTVINLGIGGQGQLAEFAALVEYGQHKTPDKVFLLFYEGNDLEDLSLRLDSDAKKDKVLMQYLSEGFQQDLRHHQEAIDRALLESLAVAEIKREEKAKERHEKSAEENRKKHLVQKLADRLRFRALRNASNIDFLLRGEARQSFEAEGWIRRSMRYGCLYEDVDAGEKDSYECDEDSEFLFNKILLKTKKLVEGWGGELFFVYLPMWSTYVGWEPGSDTPRYLGARKNIVGTVKSLGIPVIDIHEKVFTKHPDPLDLFPFRQFAHYNKEGYKRVAQAIMEVIDRRDVQE